MPVLSRFAKPDAHRTKQAKLLAAGGGATLVALGMPTAGGFVGLAPARGP
eukprot:CAMPEP_0171271992 /NCGR_PEP_ID=MMETSP0790-20130122/61520_1 /TAXON_ID=2925 /ORGANISM="Alexandrium catenella, Strain OF101" /LENGTH=49 /DNA_ID= /DNA_START= /DNA_END= /DNA_ORIENTATION=